MPLPKEDRYTMADVLSWDEQKHTELIEGVPVMMAPPTRVHQEISGALFAQLHNYLEEKPCKVYAAPFAVRLFEGAGEDPADVDTMVEPDLSVVCDNGKLDDRGCVGAPDMVIEILSPSTQRHDRLTKYNLYQRAGVREYWIVDPESKSIQTFTLEDGRYSAHGFGTAGDALKVTVLEDCVLELSKVFQAI